MVENFKYAGRKLAEHFRMASLAGAAGAYATFQKLSGDDVLTAVIAAISVWSLCMAVAVLVDVVVGEGRKP
ncbi:hypothetical protein [Chitinimonas koreensis]|uniref:hypothetical protein n=1 Tax=Chitinimonas koreensis TaxID=356302 RepID=UPI0005550424|nr:hypothetical protein [Chitinimonas koreensis]QNM95507.1 hypothetical protein H9L41_16775 [Chitinimonas koreensis]